MVVMTLETVPPRLRGLLTRWLIEIQSGVYVGQVSKTVRDLLWDRAVSLARGGRISQAWPVASDQGFQFRLHGDDRRHLIDLDGFSLVTISDEPGEEFAKRTAAALDKTR